MRDPRSSDREPVRGHEPADGERYVAGDSGTRDLERERVRDADYSTSRVSGDPDVSRPVERETVRRDVYESRPTEYSGVRYGSTAPYSAVELKDMVRWGPILAGFAATVATLILMGVLGGAIGATTVNQTGTDATQNAGTFGLIWGAVTLILSFLVGGWLASRTSGIGGQMSALVNSGLVWAFTLLFALVVASLGFAGLSDMLGNVTSGLNFTPGAAAAASDEAMAATWGTLAGMVLALASALVGGIIGKHEEPEPLNR